MRNQKRNLGKASGVTKHNKRDKRPTRKKWAQHKHFKVSWFKGPFTLTEMKNFPLIFTMLGANNSVMFGLIHTMTVPLWNTSLKDIELICERRCNIIIVQRKKVFVFVTDILYIHFYTKTSMNLKRHSIDTINMFIKARPTDPVNVKNAAEHSPTGEVPGSCRSIRPLRTYDPQVSARQPAGGWESSGGSVTTCSSGNARISGRCEAN